MLTIAITAATPMMMPSIVRAARILLRTSARNATRMIIKRFMVLIRLYPSPIRSIRGRFLVILVLVNGRHILQFFRRIAPMLDRMIRFDLSVLEHDHAVGIFRDVRFVRDQHQSYPSFAIQA